MATVGEFLLEKMKNMRTWLLENSVKCDGLPVPNGPLECVVFAQHLAELAAAIHARDYKLLIEHDQLTSAWRQVIVWGVIPQVELHDKFWRYLECFVEAVEPEAFLTLRNSSDGRQE